MPSIDSIRSIPTAFRAICLNASSLALFQTSGALETFFEIFETTDHIECRLTEHELASLLGSQFDELVRHHPVLRENVMKVVIEMLRSVEILGRKFAEEKGMGPKLWIEDGYGEMVVAGGRKELVGKIRNHSREAGAGSSTKPQRSDEEDVEMGDADDVASMVTFEETSPDGSPKTEVVALSDIIDEEAVYADRNKPSIDNFIDAAGRAPEEFLANANLSKDFIKRGGLDFLLDFYTVSSFPYDFATNQANQMMSRVLQVCGENSPSVTVAATLNHALKAIHQPQPLLQHDKKEAFFAPLTDRMAAILSPPPQGGICCLCKWRVMIRPAHICAKPRLISYRPPLSSGRRDPLSFPEKLYSHYTRSLSYSHKKFRSPPIARCRQDTSKSPVIPTRPTIIIIR